MVSNIHKSPRKKDNGIIITYQFDYNISLNLLQDTFSVKLNILYVQITILVQPPSTMNGEYHISVYKPWFIPMAFHINVCLDIAWRVIKLEITSDPVKIFETFYSSTSIDILY